MPTQDPMLSLGLELTFLPRRPRSEWQEFRVRRMAETATMDLKWALRAFSICDMFKVKVDPFRQRRTFPDQPHNAWCVEVNNIPFKSTDLLARGAPYTAVEKLFDIAARHNLYPHITKTASDGTVKEWPTGGGHIHVGLDFMREHSANLLLYYWVERALCLDYVNHPFIRWLFSQWMDDINSELPFRLPEIKEMESRIVRKTWTRKKATEIAHGAALTCHSIKQRFAVTGKPCLPTYEFRFFDMPRSVEELRLQVQFLVKWIGYRLSTIGKSPPYRLTPEYFTKLTTNMRFARDECERFFSKVGLDFGDYTELSWERAYLPRMRYGYPR